jgi:hypothetical protein
MTHYPETNGYGAIILAVAHRQFLTINLNVHKKAVRSIDFLERDRLTDLTCLASSATPSFMGQPMFIKLIKKVAVDFHHGIFGNAATES